MQPSQPAGSVDDALVQSLRRREARMTAAATLRDQHFCQERERGGLFDALSERIQRAHGGVRAIVSIDLDGTLVHGVSSGQLVADSLGHGDMLRALENEYDAGQLSARAVAEAEASRFRGLRTAALDDVYGRMPYLDGIAEATAWLGGRGVVTVVNTLAWSFIAAAVRDRFGFDCSTGVQMLCDSDGRLTGRVHRHFDEHDKAAFVKALAARLGVPLSCVVAIGDARSDLPLFALAGFSIALNGTPSARAAASCAIDTRSLPDVLDLIPTEVLSG